MEDDQLPLADVRAKFTGQRSGGHAGYSITFQIGIDALTKLTDQRQMDAFLRSDDQHGFVRLTLRSLPPDWESGPVDPNPGTETEVDVTARLSEEWQELLMRMTDART